jgi:hypothetical protein
MIDPWKASADRDEFATDALFNALWIPRKVVVHDERAKPKVDAFRTSLSCNHDAAFVAKIVHERRAHVSRA